MKIKDIIVEGQMKELKMIIDDAEAKVFDTSAKTKSSVNGDEVLKHAIRGVKQLNFDKNKQEAAIKIITNQIAKEYGG